MSELRHHKTGRLIGNVGQRLLDPSGRPYGNVVLESEREPLSRLLKAGYCQADVRVLVLPMT